MHEMRDFFETTGVSLGFLIAILFGLYRLVRAVLAWLKPRIEELFTRHFSLIESLIARNEQQYLADEDSAKRLGTLFTRRDACTIAECHCNIIEGVVDGDSGATKQHLDALRTELRRMKQSDHERIGANE
jgi:hypothetical protein